MVFHYMCFFFVGAVFYLQCALHEIVDACFDVFLIFVKSLDRGRLILFSLDKKNITGSSVGITDLKSLRS